MNENKIEKSIDYFFRCGIDKDTIKYINKIFSDKDSKTEFYKKCIISVSKYMNEIYFDTEAEKQILELYPNVNKEDIKGMKFNKKMMFDCIVTNFLQEKIKLIENERKNLQKQILKVF